MATASSRRRSRCSRPSRASRLRHPACRRLVVPVALVILCASSPSSAGAPPPSARVFGPVMIVWFVAIGVAGAAELAADRASLAGCRPTRRLRVHRSPSGVAFVAMGAVMLAITGAEALYADMGHFGRPPIRGAWFALVFPALTLNYLGQSSARPAPPDAIEARSSSFSRTGARIPMVRAGDGRHDHRLPGGDLRRVLALAPGRPARLPAAPDRPPDVPARRSARSTCRPSTGRSSSLVVAVVVGFGSSERLGSAYGVAVSGMFVITTVLFLAVARGRWHWPTWLLLTGAAVFLPVEATFLAANLARSTTAVGSRSSSRARLPHDDDLASRERDRQRQPDAAGGAAACVRLRAARAGPAASARLRDGGVPQPVQGDDAARAAGERRAQPRAARACGDRHRAVRRHAARAPDAIGSRSTTSASTTTTSPTSRAVRLPGAAERPAGAPPGR